MNSKLKDIVEALKEGFAEAAKQRAAGDISRSTHRDHIQNAFRGSVEEEAFIGAVSALTPERSSAFATEYNRAIFEGRLEDADAVLENMLHEAGIVYHVQRKKPSTATSQPQHQSWRWTSKLKVLSLCSAVWLIIAGAEAARNAERWTTHFRVGAFIQQSLLSGVLPLVVIWGLVWIFKSRSSTKDAVSPTSSQVKSTFPPVTVVSPRVSEVTRDNAKRLLIESEVYTAEEVEPMSVAEAIGRARRLLKATTRHSQPIETIATRRHAVKCYA